MRLKIVQNAILSAFAASTASAATGDHLDRSRLVPTFMEEFEGAQIDLYNPKTNPNGRWRTFFDFGDPAGPASRTLHGEDEIYVDDWYGGASPFEISDHALTIKAVLNDHWSDPKTAGKVYASGLLTTSASFRQSFGYFEIRASLPPISGAWPQFWLTTRFDPTLKPPLYGDEIDIMEFLGNDPHAIYCSLYWRKSQWHPQETVIPVQVESVDRMRNYGALWTETEIVWYVDDIEVARQPNPGLRQPMSLVVNLAVGGWNNNHAPASIPTMKMLVAWVHAYGFK